MENLKQLNEEIIMPASINNLASNGSKPVLVTQNPKMKELYQNVKLVARSEAPVFITGESGTGKEVIARLLHFHSKRKNKPFIALNCGAIPRDIVESELFGHEKGSFTGAVSSKTGCFEQADKGMLFLDEVAEMNPEIQVKLLRAVELNNFRKIGGTKEIQTDVQVISATNRNVHELMSEKGFREDLYYRLSVIELYIPPLRERKDDIPLLSKYFLSRYLSKKDLPRKDFSEEFINYLLNYDWPGNVRELRNVIERCAIMCNDNVIHTDHLPRSIGGPVSNQNLHENLNSNGNGKHFHIPVGTTMENAEKIIINRTLSYTGNNISEAARILEVSRNTLHNKLAKFNE